MFKTTKAIKALNQYLRDNKFCKGDAIYYDCVEGAYYIDADLADNYDLNEYVYSLEKANQAALKIINSLIDYAIDYDDAEILTDMMAALTDALRGE